MFQYFLKIKNQDREPPTQVSSAAVPTLPASSGEVRRLLPVNSPQPVPSTQVISDPTFSDSRGHALGADEARDAVSDTASVGHDSDLRSVVPSEASSEPADEPGMQPTHEDSQLGWSSWTGFT